MAHYFVTGTGTEVGKTFATCALLEQNASYRAIKPVLSGYEPNNNDAAQIMAAQRAGMLDEIAPWRFAAPVSPHLAAAQEKREISPKALVTFCQEQMRAQPNLLIEAVGGLMVPITPRWLVIDWMKALNIPVVLVSSSYLGAINHTLLSLEVLNASGLPVQAVIINQAGEDVDAGLEETAQAIAPFLEKEVPLVRSPRVQGADSPWKNAAQLLSL